ncbi:MAG: serine/threonine-protein kinase [Acidobacteriota bacterium]
MATEPPERQIFEACLTLSRQERVRFIRRACTGHPELVRRLFRLLEAHDRAEEGALAADQIFSMGEPAKEIGSYRLLNVIGEGGMGVVYKAEQLYPVKRVVALKLIRWGLDSRQVVARFEAERQALAVMDHPNIARVLDAGAASDGRPFFVMELVPGDPLTTFCDQQRLSIRQRLELFGCLARAVQHAHQKGVIHRDLKPSNVIVARQDGTFTLKVIDFGIAKAIGNRLGDQTLVTQVGTALGTPAYMSPEQAETDTLDIDTRTDIYSLGVILYELAVGVLPISPEEIGMPAFLAQLGDREIEPVLPSTRLLSLGERAREIAATRRTELFDLVGELKGDLDWLIRKAIDKDRSQRYESADALAVEVRRYLNNEPLLARPPSLPYRCRKLLRRHRPVVAAASVVLVALLVAVVGIAAGLVQAERSRQEALRQAVKATEAGRNANSRLRHALIAQARALRGSRTPGRRAESLKLLSQAAALRPGPDLRDEGIASITLTDLERVATWPKLDLQKISVDFDDRCERFAWGILGGRVEIHREGEDEPPLVLPGFGLDPWVLKFSSDGGRLAVKYHGDRPEAGGCVKIWDSRDGRLVAEIATIPLGSAMDFSPDGLELAMVTRDQRLIFLDLQAGQARLQIRLKHPSSDLAYRHDGDAVALSTEMGMLEIRDARDGRLLQELDHPGRVYRADWSDDGNLLAGAYSDGTAVIWRVKDGKALTTLRGHQAEVVRVGFHPVFPLVFTYSWDETSRLWEIPTGRQLLTVSAQALEFSSDGQYLSYVDGNAAGIWRLRHGEMLHTYYGHLGKGPRSLDLSSDSRRMVSGGLDGLRLWDTQNESPVAWISTPDVRDVFFSADGDGVISCGRAGLLRWSLWDDDGTPRVSGRRVMVDEPCEHAAMDPLGEAMVSLHQGDRVYLHLDPGRSNPVPLAGFPGMAHPSLTLGGTLVAAGNWRGDRTVIWNGRNGQILRTLLPGKPAVGVAFSPDGRWLVTGSSEEYRLWDTSSWTNQMRIHRPSRFSHLPGLMAFSDDGRLLAVVIDNRTIGLYDPQRKRPVLALQLPDPQAFSALRFSGDGRCLGASTTARRIHVWDIKAILEALHPLGLDFGLAEQWPGGSPAQISSDAPSKTTDRARAQPGQSGHGSPF